MHDGAPACFIYAPEVTLSLPSLGDGTSTLAKSFAIPESSWFFPLVTPKNLVYASAADAAEELLQRVHNDVRRPQHSGIFHRFRQSVPPQTVVAV